MASILQTGSSQGWKAYMQRTSIHAADTHSAGGHRACRDSSAQGHEKNAPSTVVVGRLGNAHQAHFSHLLDSVDGKLVRLVPLAGVGSELGVGEGSAHVAQHFVLIAARVHHTSSPVPRGGSRCVYQAAGVSSSGSLPELRVGCNGSSAGALPDGTPHRMRPATARGSDA